jgi:Flp pilus assembly protein protease CpaA
MTTSLPILGTLLAIAAASDVSQRRIPNAIVAPLAAAGLAAQWAGGGAGAAGSGLLAGCIVLGVLVLPWARGLLGAGDVKLAAATATWLGAGAVVPFLLYSAVAAVPVALAARLAHRHAVRRFASQPGAAGIVALPRESVPVAVAVAIAALAVAWGRP